MTPTTNSGLESKAESPVRVLEKNGHLQLFILYVISLIRNGLWNPQDLGNHSSDTQDTMVNHPRLIGEVVDDERTADWHNPKQGRNGFALQDVKKVSLSHRGAETMGYVPDLQRL
jgi:hypothetical protein